MSTTPSRSSKLRRYGRVIAVNILALAVLLVFVEGLASYLLLVHDLAVIFVPPYRLHTQYDPELGWLNRPNVYIPNLYGRGIYLRTNSAGFRNNSEFNARVPKDKYRIICTGDSFTLGVGVDNDHTWCHLLTVLDPRVEAVNMGQPGYGVDQAYLLYKRAGSQLDHDAHLFALIGSDIDRMQSAQFQGYDKPLIRLENGALVVGNVPIPRRSYYLPWLTDRKAIFNTLRTADFVRRVRQKAQAQVPPSMSSELARKEDGESKTRDVLRLLFSDLKRLNEERGSALCLVYLPALSDFQPGRSGSWSDLIQEESRALGVPLINVLGRFQSLANDDAQSMFILPGQGTYPGVNHLNERGNAFVAKVIYEELKGRVAIPHRQR
jgi:hypothetical protein